MSDRKRTRPETQLSFGKRWLAVGVPSISGALWAKYDDTPRNLVPEPLDFFDHASSFAGTFGVCSTLALTTAWATRRFVEGAETSTLRRAAYVSAVAAGVIMNAIAELKLGFGTQGSVGEPYDFAYGLAGAVAGAAVVEMTPMPPPSLSELDPARPT